jgi:hypothetical protein
MNRILFSDNCVSSCEEPSLTRVYAYNLLVQLFPGLAWAVTLGSNSRRSHDHILPYHLRLPQPVGLGFRIYITPERGNPVILLGTEFLLRRLLRFTELWWRYSNLLPHGFPLLWSRSSSSVATDGQSACFGVGLRSGTYDQIFIFRLIIVSCVLELPCITSAVDQIENTFSIIFVSIRYHGNAFVSPRVEAGKNTSTVIPASRKRQTHTLIGEGAPRRRAMQFSDKRKEKVKSVHGPLRNARYQVILTD